MLTGRGSKKTTRTQKAGGETTLRKATHMIWIVHRFLLPGLEMDPWLRVISILPEGLSSVPCTHVGWLTAACNSNSRKFNASVLCSYPHQGQIPKHRYMHVDIILYLMVKISSQEIYNDISLDKLPSFNPKKMPHKNMFSAELDNIASLIQPDPHTLSLSTVDLGTRMMESYNRHPDEE